MKILTLVLEKYQDIELVGVISTLNNSGQLEKITYYNPNEKTNIFGSNKIGSIMTVSTYDIKDYDAIFIPGGEAAQELRVNQIALNVVKDFIDNDKYIISMCDSPNALCDAKLLTDKKYVSYPIQGIEKSACPNRVSDQVVMVDGKYITGRGPSSSLELGLKVIEILISKKKSDEVRSGLFA
ncbi:MAG: DJ-1/PfpI family protein [Mycoplasmataceae bacterium]|nr:DJ-1/PfpI family protein [Mycoplasmataceae bacterium]